MNVCMLDSKDPAFFFQGAPRTQWEVGPWNSPKIKKNVLLGV